MTSSVGPSSLDILATVAAVSKRERQEKFKDNRKIAYQIAKKIFETFPDIAEISSPALKDLASYEGPINDLVNQYTQGMTDKKRLSRIFVNLTRVVNNRIYILRRDRYHQLSTNRSSTSD